MKKCSETRGTIVEKRQGDRRYYYFSRSHRVKVDPSATGKTRGTGKSRVVSDRIYLGTAESILEKCRCSHPGSARQAYRKRPFGLPAALFEVALRSGLRHCLLEASPESDPGNPHKDFTLVRAIASVVQSVDGKPAVTGEESDSSSTATEFPPGDLTRQSFLRAYDFVCANSQWNAPSALEEGNARPGTGGVQRSAELDFDAEARARAFVERLEASRRFELANSGEAGYQGDRLSFSRPSERVVSFRESAEGMVEKAAPRHSVSAGQPFAVAFDGSLAARGMGVVESRSEPFQAVERDGDEGAWFPCAIPRQRGAGLDPHAALGMALAPAVSRASSGDGTRATARHERTAPGTNRLETTPNRALHCGEQTPRISEDLQRVLMLLLVDEARRAGIDLAPLLLLEELDHISLHVLDAPETDRAALVCELSPLQARLFALYGLELYSGSL